MCGQGRRRVDWARVTGGMRDSGSEGRVQTARSLASCGCCVLACRWMGNNSTDVHVCCCALILTPAWCCAWSLLAVSSLKLHKKVTEYLMWMAGLFWWPSTLDWIASFESLWRGNYAQLYAKKLVHFQYNGSGGISIQLLHFLACHIKWRAKANWFWRMNSPFKAKRILQTHLIQSACAADINRTWLAPRSESLKKTKQKKKTKQTPKNNSLNIFFVSRYKNKVCILGEHKADRRGTWRGGCIALDSLSF